MLSTGVDSSAFFFFFNIICGGNDSDVKGSNCTVKDERQWQRGP